MKSVIHKIGNKYYDFTPSKNESFLLTAQELKDKGIKNYYFMLEIKNPRVADIDPFNPNITKQEMEALLIEYTQNMWYFMRTAVRMRTGMGVVPMCLHRGLAAMAWCFERHQDNCLCEPRQTYKTTGTLAGPIQWAFQLSHDCIMHFFGKETENTQKNLLDLKNDIECLPKWLQFRTYMSDEGKVKKSAQNVKTLENGVFHNKINTHPKANSVAAAQGLGRGGSGQILYFDEAEHTLFFSEILANSAPLFKTASENAKAARTAYCRLLSCTPGDLDTKVGREAKPIIDSMIPWTERMYDMTEVEIQEYKNAFIEDYHAAHPESSREVVDIMYIEYQYYQLRRDYQWVMDQYALSGDKNAIRREILLQRTHGSKSNPIPADDIDYLVSNMRKATSDILIRGKWLFKIYEHGARKTFEFNSELDPDIPYLVGIDPAGGDSIKGDNFAVTIVNPYNLQIAAEFKSPYLTGPNAARMIQALIEDYIPRAVLCIERNSVGQYLIQHLAETNVKNNMYWNRAKQELDDIAESSPDDYQLRDAAKETQKYGQFLSHKVREAMFELLFQMIDEYIDALTTENLVSDICALIRWPSGKIAADQGEHDDCLMSYLHALYVYFVGDNLPFFGIFKEEHPIDKFKHHVVPAEKISPDEMAKALDKQDPFVIPTYDEVMKMAMAERESNLATLSSHFSFIDDPISNSRVDLMSDSVSIGAHFFDEINGTTYF